MTLTAASSTATTFDLGSARALSCRECGHEIPLAPEFACPQCFGPLEVAYDFPEVTRASIEAGPKSIWRYRQLLPVPTDVTSHPNTEPGLTRLIKADRLAEALGMRTCGSRTTPATRRTRSRTGSSPSPWPPPVSWASRVLACPSTGNLANAVAAAAARAGWDSVVLIPSSLEQAKILTTAVYGGTLLAVDGNYDDVNRLATELAAEHEDWAFVNVNVRPVLRGGLQDAGLRGRRAARVAAAGADRRPGGVGLAADQGRQGLPASSASWGWSSRRRTRCSGRRPPAARRCRRRSPRATTWSSPVRPDTIARSLAIGNPADGPYVLDAVRRTGGAVADVSDEEVVEGIRLLARTEGVFAETAGGVTVATAKKLIEAGQLDPDAETVLLITGDGLKTLDAV